MAWRAEVRARSWEGDDLLSCVARCREVSDEAGEFSSYLLTVKTLTGMTTDVYPRENCIAPAIALIVWTTNTKNRCAREG